MKKNFSLANAVVVQVESEYYDLHNCFDLVEVTFNFNSRSVDMRFEHNDKSCVDKVKKDLVMSFLDVDYIDISLGVLKNMIRDISELGYKNPDDFNHDWLMSEDQRSETDHFFIRLVSDEFIRIHGASVVLTCEKHRFRTSFCR